jgi:hypothetical protein
MKITKRQLKQIIKEEISKVLSEGEASSDLNEEIAERFTKWFSRYAARKPGHKPVHRDEAPDAALALADDLRGARVYGEFIDVVPEDMQEQYAGLFNNLASALEDNPLLTHFRKLGKRGDWYAIATGTWDESMYEPPPYSDPEDRYNYGWEDQV